MDAHPLPPDTLRERLGREWPLLATLALAVAIAGWAYLQFWPDARYLWWSPVHDRNAHYWMAQCVGLDLHNGDMLHLARDIERMRVWGPLFPLVTGVVLAIGGPDYRLAVLTSLACWVGAALFAFLAARRTAPYAGNFAGFVAAILIMASPAFQAFATDIMLEGPGACLSLAVVYAYLRARQQPSPAGFRWFALAMTALFFLKCNYWLLALFALAATEWFRWQMPILQSARVVDRTAIWAWCRAQLRHPLTYLLIVPLVLLAVYRLRGPYEIALGISTLHVGSAATLADVAYWILFVRVLSGWLRGTRAWLGERSPWAVTLVDWHLWPTAAWFLLPKRVAWFLWYMTGNHGPGEGEGWLGRFTAYTHALADDYLPGMAALVGVVLLTVVVFALARRLKPGAAFLLWFIAISAGLTMLQPTCRSRFLHSWIAATWVTAGVGLALCIHGWRWSTLGQRVASGAVIGGLLMLAVPLALERGHAVEGGLDPAQRCMLSLAEDILPQLDGSRRVAMLSRHGLRFFLSWTYQERCRQTERIVGEAYQLPADPAQLQSWADRMQCDAVVWIDIAPDSPLFFPSRDPQDDRVPELMAHQQGFRVAGRCEWSELHCSAVIWRRSGSLASRAP
jgi:hypothetical protein